MVSISQRPQATPALYLGRMMKPKKLEGSYLQMVATNTIILVPNSHTENYNTFSLAKKYSHKCVYMYIYIYIHRLDRKNVWNYIVWKIYIPWKKQVSNKGVVHYEYGKPTIISIYICICFRVSNPHRKEKTYLNWWNIEWIEGSRYTSASFAYVEA